MLGVRGETGLVGWFVMLWVNAAGVHGAEEKEKGGWDAEQNASVVGAPSGVGCKSTAALFALLSLQALKGWAPVRCAIHAASAAAHGL